MDTNIDVDQLIREVYAIPILWDKTTNENNVHSRAGLENSWKIVAGKMQKDKDAVKKKWKNLRDQYRVERLKVLRGKRKNKIWAYYEPMNFLSNHIIPRKEKPFARKHIESTSTDDMAATSAFEFIAPTKDLDLLETNETSSTIFANQEVAKKTQKLKPKFKHKQNSSISEILSIQKRMHELLEQNKCIKSQNYCEAVGKDEDESFFDSLLPHVRKLKPRQKLLCRMEIQKLVYDYAYANQESESEDNDEGEIQKFKNSPPSSPCLRYSVTSEVDNNLMVEQEDNKDWHRKNLSIE